MKISGVNDVKKYLNSEGKKLGKEFNSEVESRVRKLANKMQNDLNNSVDKGGVAFTTNAITVNIKMKASTLSCTIYVKRIQAQYLYNVIVDRGSKDKFVPTSKIKLNKYGNIPMLSRNIKSGKYKIVENRGMKRLINITAKKREDRVIGVLEAKNRKIIYDFYKEANKGIEYIISDLRGVFTYRRRGE
ncbi:hypothetical protein DMS60_20075 [Klebsiella variicola]|uniref:hypothetical protein n=1 Tax=Klebsiella variicola TaxID=244366 RepID=UPI000D744FA5|nr:hypothetical protein [Klebsiella variicola]PXL35873.1 hypothetical protein DMS60_20075 [Klebsiella variicola]